MLAADLFYNRQMGHFVNHRRLHSLIVSLAILLNLFAPAISHAVTSLTRDPLTLDICSASANVGADAKSPIKQTTHGAKHCLFCATHTDNYAPPPVAAGLLAVLDGHDEYNAPRPAVPAPRLLWSSAQPRAPPSLS
jgi:hypothetical protein